MAEHTNKEANTAPARRRNPIRFLQEVRREGSKVTWPTWKETWLTTIMVFIMVALIMVFFTIVDSILGYGIRTLLGLG
jgi:preprotein translocase subunit SecE